MARGPIADRSPFRRRSLTIPPASVNDWVHLVAWEMWMGWLVAFLLGFGLRMIATSPEKIFPLTDRAGCYAIPPVPEPCERIVYLGGMNVAFTVLCGFMMIAAAAWLLWELWTAVEPRPITDEFLRLLSDSFGHNWRNPLTWPWARVLWAYGFTSIGAVLAVTFVFGIWAWLEPPARRPPPTIKIDISQPSRPTP